MRQEPVEGEGIPQTAHSPESEEVRRKKGLTALRAATLGFFVDMYDVYLPVIALAPALVYFTPDNLSTTAQTTLFYTIFAVSLVGRPLGALVFGPLGDRIGRRKTTIISAAGFTVCTGLIAVLPGYGTWGLVPIVLLILLRLVDGMFLGGEYTAANPLAMEYAPRARRGLYGSIINTGYPAALAVITVITIVTLKLFPAGSAGSAYAVWGWRIPFVIGFFLSAGVFLYYLKSVPESEMWLKAEKPSKPLRDLFSGSNARSLGQIFVVMTGAWLTLNAVAGAVPGVLKTTLGVSPGWTNVVVLVGALVGVVLFPIMGMVGQRYGRRQTLIVLGLLNVVVTPVLYAIAVSSGFRSLGQLIVLLGVVQVSTLVVWSIVTAYITESFPTSVRASGYGIGYSLAAILPAFYSYYMLGLANMMPYKYTQIVVLAVGGLFLAFGAYIGPDNRHEDLGEVGPLESQRIPLRP
jgi:MFS family permease